MSLLLSQLGGGPPAPTNRHEWLTLLGVGVISAIAFFW